MGLRHVFPTQTKSTRITRCCMGTPSLALCSRCGCLSCQRRVPISCQRQDAGGDAPSVRAITAAGQRARSQCQHATDAFVHAAQRLMLDKAPQPFQASTKFLPRQGPLPGQPRARRRARCSGAVYSGP